MMYGWYIDTPLTCDFQKTIKSAIEQNPAVCPSCYSNHATNPNVICSRARFIMHLLEFQLPTPTRFQKPKQNSSFIMAQYHQKSYCAIIRTTFFRLLSELTNSGRDEFVMTHGPDFFEECAERIFQEFNRFSASSGVIPQCYISRFIHCSPLPLLFNFLFRTFSSQLCHVPLLVHETTTHPTFSESKLTFVGVSEMTQGLPFNSQCVRPTSAQHNVS